MKSLKRKLDYHYRYFDRSKLSPDPLEFLHRYNNYFDIEIAGIISSVFAYGNITQIINSLNQIHEIINYEPYRFVKEYSLKNGRKLFKNFTHRFYIGEDVALFFNALNKVYANYGSLKYLFLLYFFEKDVDLKNSISFFSKNLLELSIAEGEMSNGLKFMFPDPFKGSACKRMNLFFRWMVRKDELDLGLWQEIPASKLTIPVDTHVAKICKQLRLTRRKVVSWKMAEEITNKLRKLNPDDPVKYDFAICHIGMRKMKL